MDGVEPGRRRRRTGTQRVGDVGQVAAPQRTMEARQCRHHGNGGDLLPGGAQIASKLDHRIAMSMAVAGLGARDAVTIDDASPVATSYPGFFPTLDRLTDFQP